VSWSLESLETYLTAQINGLKDSLRQATAVSDKALNKASEALEKRLDLLNEFRDAMQDQAQNYVPRREYDAHHQALVDKVDENTKRLNAIEVTNRTKSEGLGAAGQIVLGAIAFLGMVGAWAAVVFIHR
jgi:predicted phage tail protein